MNSNFRYFENGPAPKWGDDMFGKIKQACPLVFLICCRNKNKNIVIYQARVDSQNNLDETPIESYWLLLEPSYQEKQRSNNIMHDREDLGFLDTTFAWGFEQKRMSNSQCMFKFKNFKEQDMVVQVKNGNANLFVEKMNRKFMIRSLYISASDDLHILNPRNNVQELYLNYLEITKKPYKAGKIYWNGRDFEITDVL